MAVCVGGGSLGREQKKQQQQGSGEPIRRAWCPFCSGLPPPASHTDSPLLGKIKTVPDLLRPSEFPRFPLFSTSVRVRAYPRGHPPQAIDLPVPALSQIADGGAFLGREGQRMPCDQTRHAEPGRIPDAASAGH